MGAQGSKASELASFDQSKSVKKSVGGRKKNTPITPLSQNYQRGTSNGASNESQHRFVENTILVWLDVSSEKPSESNQKILVQFRRVSNILQTFTDLEKCYDFINSVQKEQIFLVVSGSLGPQIAPRLGTFNQVHSIYIFCGNKANHVQWVKEHKKIKSIHTSIKDLGEILKHDLRQYDFSITAISLLPPAPVFEVHDSNKKFVYLQLMKSILLEITYDKKFRKEFLDFCQPFYSNNDQQMEIIKSFEDNYQVHSPIWWYTRKCFIYGMLRRGFYYQDMEILYKAAFFIRDLHRDIKKSHLQTHSHQYHSISTYRATGMTNSEFETVQKCHGGLLSFDDFVLTTLEKNIALKFANGLRTDPDINGIIYKIDIDPEESSVPYISLNNLSYLASTDGEILLSMNTIFRIENIARLNDRLYEITLFSTSRKDQQIKSLVEYMRETTDGLSGWYKLSKVMMDMGEYEQVASIFQHMFNQTGDSQRQERAFLQHELGYLAELKDNFKDSIKHYKQAIDIYSHYLQPTDPVLLSTYVNLGSVLERHGDLNGALKQYQNALKIVTPDDPNDAIQYNNIASILQQQGKYPEAQQSYEKATKILLTDYSSAYPVLADTYHNISGMFYSKKDYANALANYEKTLAFEEKYLPPNHPSFSSTYFNIATAYEGLKDYKKAARNAEKGAKVARHAFGSEHVETQEIEDYIGQLKKRTPTTP